MWFWKRRSFGDDFPEGFRIQRIGIADAIAIAELPPDQIAAYFRRNPLIADRLLLESYDNRYSPSTSITEQGEGYLLAGFPPARDADPSDAFPNWQMRPRTISCFRSARGAGSRQILPIRTESIGWSQPHHDSRAHGGPYIEQVRKNPGPTSSTRCGLAVQITPIQVARWEYSGWQDDCAIG
jgi:hypothetical protein